MSIPDTRMNGIAVLTHTPHPALVAFYTQFVRLGYDVFFIVDDNDFKATDSATTFVQLNEAECRKHGFSDLNPAIKKESGCSAWEKALYFFCRINTSYNHVWFIEDDVFVPRPDTISNIDLKYGEADIISSDYAINTLGVLDDWAWWRLVPRHQLPLPWAHSMICAVRLSSRLLKTLDLFIRANTLGLRLTNSVMNFIAFLRPRQEHSEEHSEEHYEEHYHHHFPRKCFFIEYIFHTLALHNQLTIVTAHELRGILWRRQWAVTEMDVDCLYHPVKDMTLHERYRVILANGEHDPAWRD